jgi:hypothetical protein
VLARGSDGHTLFTCTRDHDDMVLFTRLPVQECKMSAPAAHSRVGIGTGTSGGTDSGGGYTARLTCGECEVDLAGAAAVCTHAVLNGLVKNDGGTSLLNMGLNWSRASALSHRRQTIGDVAHGLERGGGYVALLPRSQGAAEMVLAHLRADRSGFKLVGSHISPALMLLVRCSWRCVFCPGSILSTLFVDDGINFYRWLDKTVSEIEIELTVRDAAIQTVFAVQLKIVFSPVGSAYTSSDVLAASYGADTQGLPGIEPWGPDMQKLLFASLLALRLVSRLIWGRHKKQDTAARTSRFARARSTPLHLLHEDSSLIDDTTSPIHEALTVTLRHVAKLATDYQAAPPALLLILDLSCLIALCGAAAFLISAHASVLPLSRLCDANITLGSPPCTPYATKEAAQLADEIVWSFPLSCLAPQASADTTQGSSTCAEDSSCTCGCLEKGYVYGCYRCCPDSCVSVKKKSAKVTYEKSGGLGWQCAAVKEEAKANTLEFPDQGEHRLLWPLPFNSLQGANGRGFHSWYAQGPLPLIRRRLMWQGVATVFLLLAMSARFFLLLVAASEICSVWASSGGQGMVKVGMAAVGMTAVIAACLSTAEMVYLQLTLVYAVPQGWAGFITSLAVLVVIGLATAVLSMVQRSLMLDKARTAVTFGIRPAVRPTRRNAAAEKDRDHHKFWTMKAVFGRIVSALETCVVQCLCLSMVVTASALALTLGAGGTVRAVNTVSKAYAIVIRAALFQEGPGTGAGGQGGQINLCTVVQQGKDWDWGLLLVCCAMVVGGFIKGLVLLQIMEIFGVVRGGDGSLFMHGNRKRLFLTVEDASWQETMETDLDSEGASGGASSLLDIPARDRDVNATSPSDIQGRDVERVRLASQGVKVDDVRNEDGTGGGSDFPSSLLTRYQGVKSRCKVLAHLRKLYVDNDHIPHQYSESSKGLAVLEEVGGGEAARLGLSRMQALFYHHHCKTSQHLLNFALAVPANHWLRHSSPDSLELEPQMQMLLNIREKLQEVNKRLGLLATDNSQPKGPTPAPLARGPFWQRIFPKDGKGYASGVRGCTVTIEHDRLALGRFGLAPKTTSCNQAVPNVSPLRALAMLRKARARNGSHGSP